MPRVTKDRYVTQIGQSDVPHLNQRLRLIVSAPKRRWS